MTTEVSHRIIREVILGCGKRFHLYSTLCILLLAEVEQGVNAGGRKGNIIDGESGRIG